MASGGPYLQSLAQLRSINWGKAWQWDCRFLDAPAPFNTWFPSIEAKRVISELQNREFIGFADTFEIPQASKIRTFTTTFLDDDQGTLQKWFDDWMELYTLGRGQWTARLSDVVRKCDFARLDTTGQSVRNYQLLVFPFGSLTHAVGSESRFQSFMLSFRIAGIVNPTD